MLHLWDGTGPLPGRRCHAWPRIRRLRHRPLLAAALRRSLDCPRLRCDSQVSSSSCL